MARLQQKSAGIVGIPLQKLTTYAEALALVAASVSEDHTRTKCWFLRHHGFAYSRLEKMEQDGVKFGKPAKRKTR